MRTRRRVSTESPVNATSATPIMGGDGFCGKSSVNGNGNGGRGFSKVGEAVGGTAAVICCFPCAVINLVVLAVYKVPIGLWKRAWNRRKRKERGSLLRKKNKNSDSMEGFNGLGIGLGLILSSEDEEDEEEEEEEEEEREIGKLEEEMYGQFYRGFWRSPSQKGD